MKDNKDENYQAVDLALVLGYIATKELPTVEKKIGVLIQLGYSNNDMAKICGCTPSVIRALKSKMAKKGGNNG